MRAKTVDIGCTELTLLSSLTGHDRSSLVHSEEAGIE